MGKDAGEGSVDGYGGAGKKGRERKKGRMDHKVTLRADRFILML